MTLCVQMEMKARQGLLWWESRRELHEWSMGAQLGGLQGARGEVVRSEIQQERLVLMQEKNHLPRKAAGRAGTQQQWTLSRGVMPPGGGDPTLPIYCSLFNSVTFLLQHRAFVLPS